MPLINFNFLQTKNQKLVINRVKVTYEVGSLCIYANTPWKSFPLLFMKIQNTYVFYFFLPTLIPHFYTQMKIRKLNINSFKTCIMKYWCVLHYGWDKLPSFFIIILNMNYVPHLCKKWWCKLCKLREALNINVPLGWCVKKKSFRGKWKWENVQWLQCLMTFLFHLYNRIQIMRMQRLLRRMRKFYRRSHICWDWIWKTYAE